MRFSDQCRIWGNLTLVLVVFSLILVPLAIAGIIGGILTESSKVMYKIMKLLIVFEVVVLILVAVICVLVWSCSAFFVIVLFRFWFRHQILTITTEEYHYIERFVHYSQVLRAFLRPSTQSVIAEERPMRNGKERRGSRQKFLKARVKSR